MYIPGLPLFIKETEQKAVLSRSMFLIIKRTTIKHDGRRRGRTKTTTVTCMVLLLLYYCRRRPNDTRWIALQTETDWRRERENIFDDGSSLIGGEQATDDVGRRNCTETRARSRPSDAGESSVTARCVSSRRGAIRPENGWSRSRARSPPRRPRAAIWQTARRRFRRGWSSGPRKQTDRLRQDFVTWPDDEGRQFDCFPVLFLIIVVLSSLICLVYQ